MRWFLALFVSLPGLIGSTSLAAKPEGLAIVGATVIYPERDNAAAVSPRMTIVVRGALIDAVGPAATTPVPVGFTVINGTGKWVIPGLIDGHVHFFQSGNLYTRPDAADFNSTMPYAKEVARNKARLSATFKVWLASGVTGVVDVGGPIWNFDVRDKARATDAAPRVAVAGPLISMVDDPALDLGDPPIVKIASAEAARDMVKQQLIHHPDYIKVWFIHQPGDDLAAQTAIVKATANAAHAAGVPLAVHATELDVAKAALRADADYMVHSVGDAPVDDEFISLMKQNRALYCPTLFVSLGYQYAFSNNWRATEAETRLADPQILQSMSDLDRIPKGLIPTRVMNAIEQKKIPRLSSIEAANLKSVWAAGIPVVMGTDAGNIGTLHGPSVFREMALMHESGLTSLQVLRSATSNGARALRMEGKVGTIAPGKLADLVILDADPIADLSNLSHAYRVIKGGKVFDPVALMTSIR